MSVNWEKGESIVHTGGSRECWLEDKDVLSEWVLNDYDTSVLCSCGLISSLAVY